MTWSYARMSCRSVRRRLDDPRMGEGEAMNGACRPKTFVVRGFRRYEYLKGSRMIVVLTILACVAAFFVQTWVLPIVGFLLMIITATPSRLVWRTVPALTRADMETYAAEHPWRIHFAALLFRWGLVAKEAILWAAFLLLIYYLSLHITGVSWGWVYVISFLVFLSALNNARTLNAQANSLSFRLKGGSSELRHQHGQRDVPPDEVLGPITPTRHGF